MTPIQSEVRRGGERLDLAESVDLFLEEDGLVELGDNVEAGQGGHDVFGVSEDLDKLRGLVDLDLSGTLVRALLIEGIDLEEL